MKKKVLLFIVKFSVNISLHTLKVILNKSKLRYQLTILQCVMISLSMEKRSYSFSNSKTSQFAGIVPQRSFQNGVILRMKVIHDLKFEKF